MRQLLRACAAASLIAVFPTTAFTARVFSAAPAPSATTSASTTTTATPVATTQTQTLFAAPVSSAAPATPTTTPATTTTPPPPTTSPPTTSSETTTSATTAPVINPIGARVVLEPVPVVEGISAYGERVSGATPAVATSGAPATGVAAPVIGTEFSEVDLDRAVRKESRRAQRKVARNEQRLQTIAPRTNVDRTAEMPDDPVSPAISPPDRGTIRY